MIPHDMVSELLALVEDPGGEKITPKLALRFLNDASVGVADLLFPLMPEIFRTVTESSYGGGETEFLLPTECAKLERVVVRETTSAPNYDAMLLPISQFGAVDANNLYDSSFGNGQIFYARYGDGKIVIKPTLTSDCVATYFYKKQPTEMQYDYGIGTYASATKTLSDAIKKWLLNRWSQATSYVKFIGCAADPDAPTLNQEFEIASSTDSTIITTTTASSLDGLEVEYEVYTPTNIPSKYHGLIIRQAQMIAEKRPEQIQKLQAEFQKTFAILTGGSQSGAS